jgi:hypothetical protein
MNVAISLRSFVELLAYLSIGVACYFLQPKQPQSVIATVLLCFAFATLVG